MAPVVEAQQPRGVQKHRAAPSPIPAYSRARPASMRSLSAERGSPLLTAPAKRSNRCRAASHSPSANCGLGLGRRHVPRGEAPPRRPARELPASGSWSCCFTSRRHSTSPRRLPLTRAAYSPAPAATGNLLPKWTALASRLLSSRRQRGSRACFALTPTGLRPRPELGGGLVVVLQ